MWEHYCLTEGTTMEVGKGEDCNWCGQEEEEAGRREEDREEQDGAPAVLVADEAEH